MLAEYVSAQAQTHSNELVLRWRPLVAGAKQQRRKSGEQPAGWRVQNRRLHDEDGQINQSVDPL